MNIVLFLASFSCQLLLMKTRWNQSDNKSLLSTLADLNNAIILDGLGSSFDFPFLKPI